MDVPFFIMAILDVVLVVSYGTFLSLCQHLILVVNGGILGDFAPKEKGVINKQPNEGD